MEEWFSIAAILPLVASIASLVIGVVTVRQRFHAEREFIRAMKRIILDLEQAKPEPELEQSRTFVVNSKSAPRLKVREVTSPKKDVGEVLGDHDPALVRHLYWTTLRSSARREEVPELVMSALKELATKDRMYIKRTLKNNTPHGRMRYLDGVFKRVARSN